VPNQHQLFIQTKVDLKPHQITDYQPSFSHRKCSLNQFVCFTRFYHSQYLAQTYHLRS
jgi:hypothetical protein